MPLPARGCAALPTGLTGGWLLWGEAGRGKTHLLHIWAARTGAALWSGTGLAALPELPTAGIALDDADAVTDETALLHLLNAAGEAGLPILLACPRRHRRAGRSVCPISPAGCARSPQWRSARRRTTLLRTLLARLLAERQLRLPEAVQEWLLRRLPRSAAALGEAVGSPGCRLARATPQHHRAVRGRALADLLAPDEISGTAAAPLAGRPGSPVGSRHEQVAHPRSRRRTATAQSEVLDRPAGPPRPEQIAIAPDSPDRFINRELSWLDFNHRVVEEAENPRHPLLERLRFVSISASNLDEFYSVRVAGLIGQAKAGVTAVSPDGRTPAQQLAEIKIRAESLLAEQQRVWRELRGLLREAGIEVCEPTELSADDVKWLDAWFMERVFPVLTPLAIDPAHPFPFIPNMGLVMALLLLREEDGQSMRALLPLPSQVDRFVRLPGAIGEPIRFVILDDLVGLFLDRLFPGFRVTGQGTFRLIRDTDVEFEEEAEDLVRSYETALKRRRRGVAIHLGMDAKMPEELRALVAAETGATPDETHIADGILGVVDLRAAYRR